MDINIVLQTCTALVILFNKRDTVLQEFEMLAYEQACRTIESTLKDFRDVWETPNEKELESYQE